MRQKQIFLPLRQRKETGSYKKIVLCLLPGLIGFGIILVSRFVSPEMVETFYSQRLFRVIAAGFGILGQIGQFSMAEIILILLILGLPAALISFVILLLRRPNARRVILARFLCGALLLPSLILLLFALTCAPNYNRLTFAEQSGLEIRPSTVDELSTLCLSLLTQTNEARDALGTQSKVAVPFSNISKKTQNAFNTLLTDYPFMGQAPLPAKPVFFSEVLSKLNLTGVYFPYTAEANVNVHMPDTELPFTIAHELAHTCGFMREDEANFIGYLACLRSDDPYLRYSGLYCALSHSMNALYSANPDAYFAVREQYSPALLGDASGLSEYWQPYYHTPAAKLSDTVNDVYLKANNLTDGVQSYGRMVDLLLAEARKKEE